MKKIITAIAILATSCNEHSASTQIYQLEYLVYDSVGNEYHYVKTYDHVPTTKDSIEFFKAKQPSYLNTTQQYVYTMNQSKVQQVIETLRGKEVDGETMQYILEEVGMDWQMLRQLMLSMPIEQVKYLMEEREDLFGQGL